MHSLQGPVEARLSEIEARLTDVESRLARIDMREPAGRSKTLDNALAKLGRAIQGEQRGA